MITLSAAVFPQQKQEKKSSCSVHVQTLPRLCSMHLTVVLMRNTESSADLPCSVLLLNMQTMMR